MAVSLPVVFVHGIRLSGACWIQQERLLAGRDVVAPDLPGHGNRRGERFTIDAAVDAVAEAIDQAGGRAVLVGHSLGGYVSLATAARHPDKVGALIGAGCSLVPSPLLRGAFATANRVIEAVPDSAPWSFASTLRRVVPAEIADPVIASGVAFEAVPAVMDALAALDPLADIARYRGKALLVNGRRDHFRVGEKRFLSRCYDGDVLVIPRTGHFAPFTHGEVFARAVEGVAPVSGFSRARTSP